MKVEPLRLRCCCCAVGSDGALSTALVLKDMSHDLFHGPYSASFFSEDAFVLGFR